MEGVLGFKVFVREKNKMKKDVFSHNCLQVRRNIYLLYAISMKN